MRGRAIVAYAIFVFLLISNTAQGQTLAPDPMLVKAAQDKGLPPPPPPDPFEQIRAIYPTLQSELSMSDDEMRALAPKICAASDAFNQIGPFSVAAYYHRGPHPLVQTPNGPKPARPRNKPDSYLVREALSQLAEALWDPNTPDAIIMQKLEELRAIEAKVAADLKVARDNMRALVTQRQEAVLVSYGFLD